MLGLGNSLSQIGLVESAAGFPDDYSVAFDGTGDYIDLGSPFQATFRGSWTMSWWVNLDDFASHQFMVGHKKDTNNQWYSALLSSGLWYFYTKMNGKILNNLSAASGLSGGSATGWIHVAVSMVNGGGSTGAIKEMYVNGSSINTISAGGMDGDDQDLYSADQNLYLGGLNSAGSLSLPITGKMNDVAMWSVALDDPAVAAVYWKFEENTGTTATDSAGSNDGTFAGDPQWDSSTP